MDNQYVFKFNLPPPKSLQLFHSFITPILSYGAEIWNLLTAHQLSVIDHNPEALVEYALKTDTEKVHLKFCKQIMGLKRNCSSLAVLGELGQFPLIITNLASMIKYWHRLEMLGDQSILKEAYLEMKSLPNNICLWNSNVKAVLKLLSLDAVYDNAKQYTTNALFNIVKRKLKSFFIEKWKAKINRASETSQDNRKLRFYKLFKADFKLEGYLSKTADFQKRKVLSKLRCSDHDLHIETGRHKNLSLDKRLCKHCDSQDVEDEIHFLFRCNKYAQIRDEMMQKFPEITISPLEKDLTNQFVEVMSCRTLPKTNSLIIFLCKAKNLREQNPVEL